MQKVNVKGSEDGRKQKKEHVNITKEVIYSKQIRQD